mgnify:CR=1 FL=1
MVFWETLLKLVRWCWNGPMAGGLDMCSMPVLFLRIDVFD